MALGNDMLIETPAHLRLAVMARSDAKGPVVLFSNSLSADQTMWSDVIAASHGSISPITYDTRGHGASDTASGLFGIEELGGDVITILDTLGIRQVTFCGLSQGGLIGMWLAANHPECVSGLVLANTASSFAPASMWIERAAEARKGGLDSFIQLTLQRWLTPSFQKSRPDRTAEAAQMIRSTPQEGYAGCCEVLAATNLSDLLGWFCRKAAVLMRFDALTIDWSGGENFELLGDRWCRIIGIPRLPFTHHVDHLDAGKDHVGTRLRLEPEHRLNAALYATVVLLDAVVQILALANADRLDAAPGSISQSVLGIA